MKLFLKQLKGINNSICNYGIDKSFTYNTLIEENFDFRPPISLKTPLLMLSRAFSTVFIFIRFKDI